MNGRVVEAIDELVGVEQLDAGGEMRLRKGKKKYVILRTET
ncbi:MAG: hypothetical protein PHU03_01595 [Syntrophales bacterium]|nr:hypothetical protein [Syntrophales bacterium]